MDGCWFAAAVHQLLTATYPRFSCTFVVFAVDTTVLTLLQIPSTGESSCSIWRLPWIRDASFSNTPKWQILGLPHYIPIDLHQILSRVFYPQILHQLHQLQPSTWIGMSRSNWSPPATRQDTIKGQPTLLGEAIASILLGIDDVRDGIRTLQAMADGNRPQHNWLVVCRESVIIS